MVQPRSVCCRGDLVDMGVRQVAANAFGACTVGGYHRGSAMGLWLRRYDIGWSGEPWHFFRVPTREPVDGVLQPLLTFPSFEQWSTLSLYGAALLMAVVAP